MRQVSGVARWASHVERALPALAVVAAGLGLALPDVGRSLDRHAGISWVLAVLVVCTAATLPAGALGVVRASFRRLVVVSAAGAIVLPIMAALLGRLIDDDTLRHGLYALGVAPAEVATVGLAGLAGASAAVTAGLLVGSVVLSVVLAGPVLHLLGGGAPNTLGLLGQLVVVLLVPLAAGIAVRRGVRRSAEAPARLGATVALVVLIWLVASQAQISARYGAVALAMAGFVLASAALGIVLGRGVPGRQRWSVILPVAMRDFAVAAGIASAAYGPAAAAPLGLYGLVVIIGGALLASVLRRGVSTEANG